MNHTTNYALNQWEASDPVQRADFNADNAKIDAALASMMKFEPIKTVVLPASAATMAVDISDIDWAQWRYVVLEMKLNTDGNQTVYVSTGGNDNFVSFGALSPQNKGISSLYSSCNDQVVLFPLHTPSRLVMGLTFGHGLVMGYSQLYYQHLSTLTLKFDSNREPVFLAGSEVSIFGIR